MVEMHISVPDAHKKWVDQRVADGDFASTDDYLNDLIQRDRDAAAELAWLQAELDKGAASGIDPRPVEQIFADIRVKYLPTHA